MVDSGFALIVSFGITLLLAVLAWPRVGVAPRLLRLARLDERVRLEDALKHVFTCQQSGQMSSLESLAGRLEVSTGQAASLLSRLAEMGLVQMEGDGPTLTTDGAQTAVRIVRTHRLWERYLADRTGVPPVEWHDQAERMEHTLSAEDADRLESRLGHPSWDPHGDPIPTSDGEIPPVPGIGLLNVDAGRTVRSSISRTSHVRSTTPSSMMAWCSADVLKLSPAPTVAFACVPGAASGRSTPLPLGISA